MDNGLQVLDPVPPAPAVLPPASDDSSPSIGSRVLILDQGKIEQYAAPEEILQNPATEFVKQLVGSCR